MVEMVVAYLALNMTTAFWVLVASWILLIAFGMMTPLRYSNAYLFLVSMVANLGGVVGLLAGLTLFPEVIALTLFLGSFLGFALVSWQPRGVRSPEPESKD